MWTTERELDFRSNVGNSEIRAYMHCDLLALQGLSNELPHLIGARVIVEKGYAIDAACNGALSRTHYDADITLASPNTDEPERLYGLMCETLARATGFEWVATPYEGHPQAELYEAGKRHFDDGITHTDQDAEMAHKLDVHIVRAPEPFAENDHVTLYSTSGRRFVKQLIAATVIDTTGDQFAFTVPSIDEMCAAKMHLLRSHREVLGRIPRESDIYDFGLLFQHRDFQPSQFIELQIDFYVGQGKSQTEALAIIASELVPLAHLAPEELLRLLDDQITGQRSIITG